MKRNKVREASVEWGYRDVRGHVQKWDSVYVHKCDLIAALQFEYFMKILDAVHMQYMKDLKSVGAIGSY